MTALGNSAVDEGRIQGAVLTQEDCALLLRGHAGTDGHTQREDTVKAEGEDAHLQESHHWGHQKLGQTPGTDPPSPGDTGTAACSLLCPQNTAP